MTLLLSFAGFQNDRSSSDIVHLPHYKDILATVNLFSRCTFNHIYREQNQAADWLSKQALLGDCSYSSGDVLPSSFAHIIRHDQMQTAEPRGGI